MKTLVLDLDETLIFSSMEPFNQNELVLRIAGQTVYTLVRPGTKSFLDAVREKYHCYIWSTGVLPYIEAIMKALDASEGFTLWGRDKCRKAEDAPPDATECYEKQLTNITEDLTQIAIVDNTPFCFRKYPMNGILSKTWRGDENDTELEHLGYYLDWLSKQKSLQRDHRDWRIETLCMRAMMGKCFCPA